jgi:hypothetical protein
LVLGRGEVVVKILIALATTVALVGPAAATEDFCIETVRTRDGFVALREGPGTQYNMMAKLKPGFPLDTDTWGGGQEGRKWTRVWFAAGS